MSAREAAGREPAVPPGSEAAARAASSDLAASFVRGQDGSLAGLYREHASLVFGIAARAVGPAEAEDVTQAVFVSAWRGRTTFDPARGTLAGWLVGITRHRVADALSARRRRGEVLVDEVEPLLTGGDRAPPEGGEHDQAVSDRVTVLGALDDLGEPRRTLVALAFFEEMTHREISDTTGLPLGTVKSHLRRALLHLRGLLEDPAAADAPAGLAAPGAATGPTRAPRRTPSTGPSRARGTGWQREGEQA